MILTLPFPPSVNAMYLNMRGKGRVKSPEYRDWLLEAGNVLMRQVVPPCFASHHRITVRIDLDDRRQGDCDNRAKAVMDLLVASRVIPGDSKKHVKSVMASWEHVDGCRVKITRVKRAA